MDDIERKEIRDLRDRFKEADSCMLFFDRVSDRENRKIGIGPELLILVAEALDLLSKVEDEER